MGQSIDECELLTGTRSAEGIMASGPVSRTNRPNTWLLRPALRRDQSLDSLEPSTHGPKLTIKWSAGTSATDPKQTSTFAQDAASAENVGPSG